MSDVFIAAGKDGYDADDPDLSHVKWDTRYNAFAIWKQAPATLAVPAGDGVHQTSAFIDIPHGLNFTPSFLAFAELQTGKIYAPTGAYSPDGAAFNAFATHTNLRITITINVGGVGYATGKTFNLYYYIFGDTTNELNTQTAIPNPSSIGIRVMKAGYDEDNFVEHQVFSDDCPPMKIAKIDARSFAIPNTAAVTTISIPHGLTFIPAFYGLVAGTFTSSFRPLPQYYRDPVALTPGPALTAYADTSNVNIICSTPSTGWADTRYSRMVIFGDRAA